jgi:hypothetical protein
MRVEMSRCGGAKSLPLFVCSPPGGADLCRAPAPTSARALAAWGAPANGRTLPGDEPPRGAL